MVFNCIDCSVSDLLLSDNDFNFSFSSACSDSFLLNNGSNSLLKPNELNNW